MEITITYNQIITFRRAASEYLKGKKESHFTYALNKMLRTTKSHHEDFADKETQIRTECASVDKDKNLIVTNGAYVYTKEKAQEVAKRTRELMNTGVTITCYHATNVPEDLDPLQRENFCPFVVAEMQEPVKENQ